MLVAIRHGGGPSTRSCACRQRAGTRSEHSRSAASSRWISALLVYGHGAKRPNVPAEPEVPAKGRMSQLTPLSVPESLHKEGRYFAAEVPFGGVLVMSRVRRHRRVDRRAGGVAGAGPAPCSARDGGRVLPPGPAGPGHAAAGDVRPLPAAAARAGSRRGAGGPARKASAPRTQAPSGERDSACRPTSFRLRAPWPRQPASPYLAGRPETYGQAGSRVPRRRRRLRAVFRLALAEWPSAGGPGPAPS